MTTVRMDDLTPEMRNVVRALIEADQAAKLRDPAGAAAVAKLVGPALERVKERALVEKAIKRSKRVAR